MSIETVIAELWKLEEEVNCLCMDVQSEEEDKGNFTSGLGEICAPEDAAPELDHARTLIQEAIEQLEDWQKQKKALG